MNQLLLILTVAIVLAGCGEKIDPLEPETNPQPKIALEQPKTNSNRESKQPESTTGGVRKAKEKQAYNGTFTNSLEMVFKTLPGTQVRFCIWETRVKDYAVYAAANTGVNDKWKNPGFEQEETHPVVMVSWENARAFCAWLTHKEQAAGKITAGEAYRLPTDEEWSVAVGLGEEKGNMPKEKGPSPFVAEKVGNTELYPWGKEWPPAKGAGNYSKSLTVDKFDKTAPAGSFMVNQIGIYDLGGNVWEWCNDWYDPAAQKYRVLRGASWLNGQPGGLLSSFRNCEPIRFRNSYIGFRCVLAGE